MDSFELKSENEFDEKPILFEADSSDKKDLFTIFTENKTFLYSIIFYGAGLLCGSFIYKNCQNDVLDGILSAANQEFLQMFLNNLCLYMLVFAVSVLLGVCLVGFPVINLIPFVIGFASGMKVTFYYINHGVKGIGYSLLMVVPFVCLFLTVIIYSVSMSYEMSKNIYDITIKKSDMSEEFSYKTYLKKYLAYAGLIIVVSLINTAICTALNGLISI